MPLLDCVLNQALQELLLQRVHYVEEVSSVWKSALGQFVREVLHEDSVIHTMRPQVLDRKLIVLWHHYHFDLIHWQEGFFTRNNLAQEIFVAHQSRWNVLLA